MENEKFAQLISLLLIQKVKTFRNDYDLCKVLSWKFKIIEFVYVAKNIVENKWATRKLINQVHHYEITEPGSVYLKENLEWLTAELRNKCKEELSFIENLLS